MKYLLGILCVLWFLIVWIKVGGILSDDLRTRFKGRLASQAFVFYFSAILASLGPTLIWFLIYFR